MSTSQNKTVRAQGYTYVYFGKLVEYGHDDYEVWVKNEDGHIRSKRKIYESWRTTLDKLKDMVDKPIITSTTYTEPSKANRWFSDVYVDEKYRGYLYDDKGNRRSDAQYHGLLQTPNIRDEKVEGMRYSVREMIVSARIAKQDAVYWAKRRQAWDFADIQEANQYLQEENALLSKEDKKDLSNQVNLVKEAMPKWLDSDKLTVFRLVKGDRSANGKMTHPDVEFARRLRIDTTDRVRIEAHVVDYLDGNFVKVRIKLKGMSEPVECGLGIMKLHKENAWQIKTVRPLHRTSTHYKLERPLVENIKDNATTVEECFDVYDKVMKQMPND